MNKKDSESVSITPSIVSDVDKFDLSNAEYDTLVQIGIEVSESKIHTQWVLGKLGDAVTQKYGDLKKYADEIRQDYGSLRQYMSTYRKFASEDPSFHPSRYYGSIPWGVLALAASKSTTPQKLIDELQKANKEVSLKLAYREIKRLESPDGIEPPRKPVVKLQWDKNSNLYTLIMDPKDFPSIDWTAVKRDLKDWLDGMV